MRLDQCVKERGIAPSREKARALIEEGLIYVDGVRRTKPAFPVEDGVAVEMRGDSEILRYVGRGGLKLEAALRAFRLDVTGMRAVDIGASTGGFTDCLLRCGAGRVIAVDCGSGQLHPALAADPRVKNIENFNAKDLTEHETEGLCDVAVMDVSFISQTALHPAVKRVLKPEGVFVSLIKPQFEAGRQFIRKNGIVKDPAVRQETVKRVVEAAQARGLHCLGVIESPITGGDGNVEYLAGFINHTAEDGAK